METQAEMPRYKCHKEVHALKIKEIHPKPNPDTTGKSDSSSHGATIVPADDGFAPFEVDSRYINKHNPRPGGYFVVYEDGYQSYSPGEIFENGYTRID